MRVIWGYNNSEWYRDDRGMRSEMTLTRHWNLEYYILTHIDTIISSIISTFYQNEMLCWNGMILKQNILNYMENAITVKWLLIYSVIGLDWYKKWH